MKTKLLTLSLCAIFSLTSFASADDLSLPSEAATAIFKKFPKGKVTHIAIEEDTELELYEVEVIDSGKHHAVKVTNTGLVLTIETETPLKFAPNPVQEAFGSIHEKAKVSAVTKVEALVEMKVKTLDKAKTIYNVYLERNGLVARAEISADGVLRGPVFWKTAAANGDEDHDEEDEEEEEDDPDVVEESR
ncbi:MAG: PepSY domain-containing protein, partial [Planctomycetota bacterium]|nr:PepSY domain-containing protein [Planctomycetota bacterium]